jgi:hypothetical protein
LCPDYNPDETVWRLEFQLRREYLKTLISKESCNRELRTISIKYSLINITMLAGVIIYKIVEHNHAVPTP